MKRLYRSRDERMVSGVLGGLSVYFDVDPTIVRLLFILLVLLTGFFPLVIAYFIAVVIIPEQPYRNGSPVVDQQ